MEPSQFKLRLEELTPLSYGQEIIGWWDPFSLLSDDDGFGLGLGGRSLHIIMQDELYTTSVQLHTFAREFESPRFADVNALLKYRSVFYLHLPPGALDLEQDPSGGQVISHTEKSLTCIFNALSNYATLLRKQIASDLNASTPAGFLEQYSKLKQGKYPYVHHVAYRGRILDDMVSKSRMVRATKHTVKLTYVSFLNFNQLSPLLELGPNILIVADSATKFAMGQNLFRTPAILSILEQNTKRISLKPTAYYLCKSDDPLADWVDGPRFTVEEVFALIREDNIICEDEDY